MKRTWWRYAPLTLAFWSGQEWRAGGWWIAFSAVFWFAGTYVLDRLLQRAHDDARTELTGDERQWWDANARIWRDA